MKAKKDLGKKKGNRVSQNSGTISEDETYM